MRIYVAAKFEEAERARAFMDRVEPGIGRITHDWTNEDPATPEALLAGCASKDVQGAATADAVVLLWHPALQGGLVEIGVALGLGITVVIVGAPAAARCIFFRLCQRVETEDQALALLAGMKGGGR